MEQGYFDIVPWKRLATPTHTQRALETLSGEEKETKNVAWKSAPLQSRTQRPAYSVAHVHQGCPLPSFPTGNLVPT